MCRGVSASPARGPKTRYRKPVTFIRVSRVTDVEKTRRARTIHVRAVYILHYPSHGGVLSVRSADRTRLYRTPVARPHHPIAWWVSGLLLHSVGSCACACSRSPPRFGWPVPRHPKRSRTQGGLPPRAMDLPSICHTRPSIACPRRLPTSSHYPLATPQYCLVLGPQVVRCPPAPPGGSRRSHPPTAAPTDALRPPSAAPTLHSTRPAAIDLPTRVGGRQMLVPSACACSHSHAMPRGTATTLSSCSSLSAVRAASGPPVPQASPPALLASALRLHLSSRPVLVMRMRVCADHTSGMRLGQPPRAAASGSPALTRPPARPPRARPQTSSPPPQPRPPRPQGHQSRHRGRPPPQGPRWQRQSPRREPWGRRVRPAR